MADRKIEQCTRMAPVTRRCPSRSQKRVAHRGAASAGPPVGPAGLGGRPARA